MLINPSRYKSQYPWQRIPGLIFIIAGIVYLYWLINHINADNLLISTAFVLVQSLSYLVVSISVINSWNQRYRIERPKLTTYPDVGVIIPTYGETIDIIEDTIRSCLYSNYKGNLVVYLSNDDQNIDQVKNLEILIKNLQIELNQLNQNTRKLYLRHSTPHSHAKAGNLNQALQHLKQFYPQIDLVLTQDADEVAYPDLIDAIVGYFQNPKIAYVQTIKQSVTDSNDPFGNQDRLFYCKTSVCRDADNAMFACGSGVMWRISALDQIGGFSAWNLVEDMYTSYQLLSKGWQSAFHYEALSHGIAPEDLPNFIKQRGTWALDTMRMFWWDNPIFKKGLTIRQKLQFLEPCLFYLNGFVTIGMIVITSASLWFKSWPTSGSAWEHGMVLLPYFLSMESYFLILAGNIPFLRVRQLWIGLSPVYVWASVLGLIYGKTKKPKYRVTRKDNQYGNYMYLVWPQAILLSIIILALLKTLFTTPLYSAFDWGALFWGIYLSSYLIQIIKLSWWSWSPEYEIDFSLNKKIFPWSKSQTTSALNNLSPISLDYEVEK